MEKDREENTKESEVREAVEFFSDVEKHKDADAETASKHIDLLCSLAESWLGRKMPEKIDLPYTAMGVPEEMWNSAIDAFRLSSVVSEEAIEKIIARYINFCNCATKSNEDVYKELARAIAEYVNGDRGKNGN